MRVCCIKIKQTATDVVLVEQSLQVEKFEVRVTLLFEHCGCGIIYRGVVDDPRTTDDAWIETTAVHFHASPDVAVGLDLRVSDTEETLAFHQKKINLQQNKGTYGE